MTTELLVGLGLVLALAPQVFIYTYYSTLIALSRRRPTPSVSKISGSLHSSVSFILPVRREPLEYIVEACRHIHALGLPSYEIIVVSDDPPSVKGEIFRVVERLREEGVNVWLIWRSEPRGFRTGALNTGLWASTGDYMYVLDVDSRPSKSLFERALGVFEADDSVVAVIGRWEPINRNTRISQALAYGLRLLVNILYSARSKLGLYTYPLGTGTLFRASVLKGKLKGWDVERIQDDMEIGARILAQGFKVVYLDDSPVYVENPETYRAFRVQQSRWAYGALDAAIARFRHIVFSKARFVVKLDALLYLMQYIPQALVFAGTALLAILAIAGFKEPPWSALLLVAWPTTLLVFQVASSKLEVASGEGLWYRLVQAGRLSAITTAVSPYVAKSTLKALFRLKETYKRTPKGAYQKLFSGLRPPIELVLGLLFAFAGVAALRAGSVISGLWLLLSSTCYLYVVLRFPRDVFYD